MVGGYGRALRPVAIEYDLPGYVPAPSLDGIEPQPSKPNSLSQYTAFSKNYGLGTLALSRSSKPPSGPRLHIG